MGNKYILDKREIKKFFIKYGIMLLISLPILILINYFLDNKIQAVAIIFIDIAIIFVVILLCSLISDKISLLKKTKGKNDEERRK